MVFVWVSIVFGAWEGGFVSFDLHIQGFIDSDFDTITTEATPDSEISLQKCGFILTIFPFDIGFHRVQKKIHFYFI